MVSKVVRSELNGRSVLISGAGVGGLMAALECWRRGCNVRVFERTKAQATSGDSFTIGPSAINTFKHWPEMRKRNDEIAYNPMIAIHKITGERIKGPFEFKDMLKTNQDDKKPLPIFRHSRPKFHDMLLEQLSKTGVKVEYGNEVVDYFENIPRGRGGVVLKDGSRQEGDLVVAADGARSQSWSLIAGRPIPARSSGDAIFRVAYPVDVALADPVVAERFKLLENGRSVIEMWLGPNMHATIWRNEDQMTWGIQHPDHGTAKESWSHRVGVEEVLKFTATVPGFPEVAERVIKTTPDDLLVDWPLMWRDPQPKCTSPGGYVVQLGDAAHTFLPSSGNGGTQAIEDAVSLAACLAKAGKGSVPDATTVHQTLRSERVSFLQALGVANHEERNTAKKKDDAKAIKIGFGSWIVDHDPEQYAFDNYEKALAHLTNGTPFKNTNTPAGVKMTPWTIDSLLEAMDKGEHTFLDEDWS